jgi:hypothetical protein
MPTFAEFAAYSAEGCDEVVVDPRAGQHPGGGGAVLAGVEVARDRDAFDGSVEVGVVEDDDRRLATEFEVHSLEAFGCSRGHLRAGPHRAGDGDHVGPRVRDHHAPRVAVAA